MDQGADTHKERTLVIISANKAWFPLPELTGYRFPSSVNMGRVDGRAFPLAELTAGPC